MASGDTLCEWGALHNEAPASNYAQLDARNANPLLDFDDVTQVAAVFRAVMPRNYAGGGVTADLHWVAVPTSGTVGWDVSFERDAGSQDIDSDGWATAQAVSSVTVPGTSGLVTVSSVAIANGANMASVVAGDLFRVRIRRDVVTVGRAVGFAQLLAVHLRET
jgi:hypothetical protein